MKLIWEEKTYKTYLARRLGGNQVRNGQRKALAEALRVHTTYISQVLSGKADLSLEQADSCNEYFKHTEAESEFFLLLVMRERAGTDRLKKHFQNKINVLLREQINIKNRIVSSSSISDQDREKFYSSYWYGAIHVLTSIPRLQSAKAIAEVTSLSLKRTREILEFLVRIGLVQQNRDRFESTSNHIHIDSSSELVLKHHSNWRQHTISQLQFRNPDDIHYSACVSLSQQDAIRIREILLNQLGENLKIVAASPEETAYVLSLDFYKAFETI